MHTLSHISKSRLRGLADRVFADAELFFRQLVILSVMLLVAAVIIGWIIVLTPADSDDGPAPAATMSGVVR